MIRRALQFLFAVFLLFRALPALGGQDAGAAFDAANKLYDHGKFAEAAGAYSAIIESGKISPVLYFNLGNAWFKAGQSGRAIAAYRQAERLAPRDPELRANLQFVRNQVQGPTRSWNWWERWLGRLTLDEWTALLAIALWLWFAMLILLQWRPGLKGVLRAYVFSGAVVIVALGAILAAAWQVQNPARHAIVDARSAAVRNGPLEESPSNLSLQDGAEVTVLDEKDDWLQIEVLDRLGWVRRDQVVRLGPALVAATAGN